MTRASKRSTGAVLVAALCLPTALAWLASSGCGSDVTLRPGHEGGGGSSAAGDEGGGGRAIAPSASSGQDAGPDGFDAWVDPPCDDQPPPIEDFACDPYDQGNGDCSVGDACDIFVEYPAEPCGQEVYGSVCVPAGPGQQGDPCAGPLDCGAGFVCVVTGFGTQCVQYCSLTGESGCPAGMVCEPIDVEGFGGCL
jgi:hypothetical protein